MLLYQVEMQCVNHNQSIGAKSATYELIYKQLPAGNLCPRNAYFARKLLSVFRPKYAMDFLCGACGYPDPLSESASASDNDVCLAMDCGNKRGGKDGKKSVAFRHFSLKAKLRELYKSGEYVQIHFGPRHEWGGRRWLHLRHRRCAPCMQGSPSSTMCTLASIIT